MIPPQNRVVVTGLGVLSSIGTGAAEFEAALRAGREGRAQLTAFDTTGFAHSYGCPVTGFDPARWLRNIPPDELSRAAQFAATAGRMAITDANLTENDLKHSHIAIGTTEGGGHELDQLTAATLTNGPEHLDPNLIAKTSAAALATAVARELAIPNAHTSTIATACAAGNYAIGDAFDALRDGEAEIALCGGAEAIARKTFTVFYRLGLIAPDHCRPFDVARRGILTAEGAAVLLLETFESARRRGARIYAEVLGYGLNCDAALPTAPTRDSVADCMRRALADAGVKTDEVDLIVAHGTGTPANDSTEAGAIRDVYGDSPPPVTGLKSMLGHAMGAASALGAAAAALAIAHRFVPPTINHRETDPACAIDCVPNQTRQAGPDIVQNNGFAFGGNNAIVIMGRHT
ncbi:MAG TPA: beta-ketoacyl-[acyl-carrier-protein] synthase family protein [Streptosporangiaceae bacterium]|nr:beta-ketoacyl-[acyl-carrier-protein] synthase family protein [Streptosporangiaceae bacterium]